MIIAAPGHPLAGRRATAAKLSDSRWVLREKGSGTRAVFEDAIEGRFRLLHVPIELGGIGAVKRAVCVALDWAVFPFPPSNRS